ncbi:MAG: non-homologous end-joining DNA ligase [Acidobacteriaceae bacterium]
MPKRTEQLLEVEGKSLKVSNLEKVLYPAVGFTKGQVIDYFIRIAPYALPYLAGRPLTLKRYPNGVDGMFFYEKNCPAHRPDWVKTVPIWSEGNQKVMDYCSANDVATLVWAGNLADLEWHTSLSLAADMDHPTMLVFDLDPGEPANVVQCCQVGMWLKHLFDQMKLTSFAKTSGSKGLKVYVPLNGKRETYDATKPFAHALARLLEEAHPELVVSDMKKSLRAGKVLVDWSQNDQHKTTVNVYSLRAKERPTVSTPVTWEEVEQCFNKKNPKLLVFESGDVLRRCEKMGDLFAPVLELKQRLPALDTIEAESPALRKKAHSPRRAKTSAPVVASSTSKTGTKPRAASKRKTG